MSPTTRSQNKRKCQDDDNQNEPVSRQPRLKESTATTGPRASSMESLLNKSVTVTPNRSRAPSTATLLDDWTTSNSPRNHNNHNFLPDINEQQLFQPDVQSKSLKRKELLLPKVQKQIPVFDPEESEVKDWIKKVNTIARIYKWEDHTTAHFALMRLRGVALLWYQSQLDLDQSWNEWAQLLQTTFGSCEDLGQQMEDIIHYRKDGQTSYYQYVYKKLAMIQRTSIVLSDLETVQLIIQGLDDKIQDLANTSNSKTPAQLANYLRKLEKADNRQFTLETKIQNQQSRSSQDKTLKLQDGSRRTIPVDRRRSSFNRSTGCDYCGYSHRTQDKRHKEAGDVKTCQNCGMRGHLQQACRQQQMEQTIKAVTNTTGQSGTESNTFTNQTWRRNMNVPMPSQVLSTSQACTSQSALQDSKSAITKRINRIDAGTREGPFHRKVKINNQEVQGFIDLGSDCSLLTRKALNKLQLEAEQMQEPVVLALIEDLQIQTEEYCTIKLEIDNVERQITCFIVGKCMPGVDILVGQDYTQQENVLYEIRSDQIVFLNKHCSVYSIGNITEEQHKKLREILAQSKSTCGKVGKTNVVKMSIKLVNNTPISARPYRMTEPDKEIVRQTITDLLEDGTIRESTSPYASPVLLQDKKTGEKRMCVDFRRLNNITVKEHYPLPLIDDLLKRVVGNCWFTSLDLASGYHQVEMDEDSIEKTAFITPEGQFEYLRMPFGLCNAPSLFQRMMDKILGSLRFTKVLVYLDDILIPSKTVEENLETTKEVLRLLDQNGLTLKLQKCFFLHETIEYLGHTISAAGIQPGERKMKAVTNFPAPTNIHTLPQFLGLTGYFRKFIKDYAKITTPLTQLLCKNIDWHWTEDQQKAVNQLKEALIQEPILSGFKHGVDTELHTDASSKGIAGILMQVQNEKLVVIEYYSRQTSLAEKNYHSFELELLAVVESMLHFRYLIVGTKVTVVTDCNAIWYTLQKKDLTPRIARWVLKLQDFEYKIVHQAGEQMKHVDALSRNPPKLTYRTLVIQENDWRMIVQQADSDIKEIMRKHTEQQDNRDRNYMIKEGILYRLTSDGERWVVPKDCRWQILQKHHDDCAHPGFLKTYERVSRTCWFPKYRRFVKKYVGGCVRCLFFKNNEGKQQGRLHPIQKHARPFHTVHLDHIGSLPTTDQGNKYLFLLVDAFTKFIWLTAVKTKTTAETVTAMENMMAVIGAPSRCITDQNMAFTSADFKQFCEFHGIKHHLIATGLPRGNGQAEIYVKEVTKALATTTEGVNWDRALLKIQLGINNSVCESIGVTPTQALLGFNTAIDTFLNIDNEPLVDVTRIRENMVVRIKKMQEKQKEHFDKRRKEAKIYTEGDLVLVKISSIVTNGQGRRLKERYKGPYRVTEVLGKDRYKVSNIRGRRYEGVYGAEHMKQWIVFTEES